MLITPYFIPCIFGEVGTQTKIIRVLGEVATYRVTIQGLGEVGTERKTIRCKGRAGFYCKQQSVSSGISKSSYLKWERRQLAGPR